MKEKNKKWENVGIHIRLLERIDELVRNGIYPSRANACNYMIRFYLDHIEDTELKMHIKK